MSRRRMGSVEASLMLGLCLVMGCTSQGTAGDKQELDPKLERFVLDKLPKTVQHETYLDFGGKVQLVGYDVSPDVATPGSKISLTLYWQRTGALDEGWGLFTHVLDAQGRQIGQFDSSGPLREADGDKQVLGPSDWKVGKIYVDKLNFEVPRRLTVGEERVPLRTGSITLAVGVWKDAARLDVLGGNSDAHRRGFVTSLKTGLSREALLPKKKKDDQKESDG